MPNVFTGQEFARHLSEGKLKESLVKIGMAKKHDHSPDTILFAEGGCEDWISIPVGVIEQVTFLQTVPCRDHQHPLVMIQFKEPPAGNETASVFAALARRNVPITPSHAWPSVPPGMGMTPGMGMSGMGTMPGMGMAPGLQGRPSQTVMARETGGGGPGGGHGGLQCIVWHTQCGWTTLYVRALGINIPWYACWDVCDIWGLP